VGSVAPALAFYPPGTGRCGTWALLTSSVQLHQAATVDEEGTTDAATVGERGPTTATS
jgi:hypothetical protein